MDAGEHRRATRVTALWLVSAVSVIAACDWPPDLHIDVSSNLPERADYRVARVVAGWPVAPAEIRSHAGPSVMTRGRPEATFRVTPAGPLPAHETGAFLVQRRVPVATAYHSAGHLDGDLVIADFAPGHHGWRDLRFVYAAVGGVAGLGESTWRREWARQCVAPDRCRVLSRAEVEARLGIASVPPPNPSERLHDPEWGDPPVGAIEPPPLPACVIECDLRRDNESASRAMDAGDAADAGDTAEVVSLDVPSNDASDAGDARAPTYSELCALNRERCDGLDNDCNGLIDEYVCPCGPGMMQRCYAGEPRWAGVGVCTYGVQTCMGSGEFGSWGSCVGSVPPDPGETCGNRVDDDCNGLVDDGCR